MIFRQINYKEIASTSKITKCHTIRLSHWGDLNQNQKALARYLEEWIHEIGSVYKQWERRWIRVLYCEFQSHTHSTAHSRWIPFHLTRARWTDCVGIVGIMILLWWLLFLTAETSADVDDVLLSVQKQNDDEFKRWIECWSPTSFKLTWYVIVCITSSEISSSPHSLPKTMMMIRHKFPSLSTIACLMMPNKREEVCTLCRFMIHQTRKKHILYKKVE